MRVAAVLVLLMFVRGATAEPYWVAWEGDCLPEEQGWTRVWGDRVADYHGTGAVRTLADGIMTMDSLCDEGVYDYAEMDRSIDPSPGEIFVAEWRIRVRSVTGLPPGDASDPIMCIRTDSAHLLGLLYHEDGVESTEEPGVFIPLVADEFHDFRLLSTDMWNYTLSVDGVVAHAGAFVQSILTPAVGWGDGVMGAASVSDWDYVRFGVLPEPSGAMAAVVACACCAAVFGRKR